ncbi:sulfatase [Tropicimonas sediminicola]|uniref:Arylsulfatase A n=1 Tax=Tropicimonas sediminicola TaxID=1031541 RepID=A0A239HV92_9RHOB|nr:sulfatase [Tropicimonas sediminicola]SNS85225.1 Arylsulfatase A [Tropicimonas sediminicola]
MRTIFVMFDSLNREALEAYGGTAIRTPNFQRLADRAVTFDNHYCGSMPCMPARRDIHTGRLNFMHRPWGPLEPFDNSFARSMGEAGIYSHLVTDHMHYIENGGTGYCTQFESWEVVRGQEHDTAKALVQPPLDALAAQFDPRHYPLDKLPSDRPATLQTSDIIAWRRMRHAVNTLFVKEEEDFPTPRVFASALEFLEMNKASTDFFLQIESFDPHEPFCAPERFHKEYATGRNGGVLDWPSYEKATDSPEDMAEIRANYAASVAECDYYLGRLLDWMDDNDAWGDTCLIVTTDHGFLLGEHEWWGKNKMPYYEEISHIPLLVWHPECADMGGERRRAVTQTPDLAATFLDLFGLPTPDEATGQSLLPALRGEREDDYRSVIFGMFAGPIGIADGSHVYYHYPVKADGEGFNLYTLAPSHMVRMFNAEELAQAELVEGFDFTHGAPVLRVPMAPDNGEAGLEAVRNRPDRIQLFDLAADPGQKTPIEDAEVLARLRAEIAVHMKRHDAPSEIFDLYGLERRAAEAVA